MDEDLRNELNRLWTDLQATQMLLCRIASRMVEAETVRAWHDDALRAVEAREAERPEATANMTRALDRLFDLLQAAQEAYQRRRNPPTSPA